MRLKGYLFLLLLFVGVNSARGREEHVIVTYDTNTVIRNNSAADRLTSSYPDSAIQLYEWGLQTSNYLLYPNGATHCLRQLGKLYSSKGMYSECMQLYKQQIDLGYQISPLVTTLPVAYNGMGNIYKLEGYYDLAASSYYKAIAITEKLRLPPTGGVYNNLASVLLFMKKYREALQMVSKAGELAWVSRNFDLLSSVITNKGLVYKDMGMADSSLYYFHQALQFSDKYNLQESAFTTRTNLGQGYLAKNDPQRALHYLLQGQRMRGDVNPFYQVTALETIALAYEMLGRQKEALHYYEEGLMQAKEFNLNENAMSLTGKLANVHNDMSNHRQAFELLSESMRFKDIVQNENSTRTITQLDVKYRTAEREKELMHQQLLNARQHSFLKKKDMLLGIAVGTLILLAIILVTMYTSYRNKRRLKDKQIFILEQEQKLLLHDQEIGQLKATIYGEERERRRLAQELHDAIGGMLTAISFNLKALQKRNAHVPEMYQLDDILSMVRETALEVRRTAHNLMPDILLNYTITEALQMYCEQLNHDSLQINLHFHGPVEQIDRFTALTIYRMTQELIQNIIKHAEASIAEIQLHSDGEKLILTIEDNGKGFVKRSSEQGKGLKSMQSRIEGLGGYISVESAPGMGTTTHIELSLQAAKAEKRADAYSHS